MKKQSRESDYIQNPSTTFIRECIRDLKKEGRCFAFKKWQVEEIQKIFKEKTTYKLDGWYYTIRICN